MAGHYLTTLGDIQFLDDVLRGDRISGRAEPRLAVIGRSNVGKSTLINSLLGKRLAQVSKEPGKTRSIHFYVWEELKSIVADLPGYGFAKVSEKERNRWSRFINAYLESDPRLAEVMVLIDGRHGPTELDLQALDFLLPRREQVTVVLTKWDGVKTQKERHARQKEVTKKLEQSGYSDPTKIHFVSSKSGAGIPGLLKCLQSVMIKVKPV